MTLGTFLLLLPKAMGHIEEIEEITLEDSL